MKILLGNMWYEFFIDNLYFFVIFTLYSSLTLLLQLHTYGKSYGMDLVNVKIE